MMGHQSDFQPKLFYHQLNLEQRIPPNHILRKIREQIDFDFIYKEVKDLYGEKGNVSVAPPVILKMMLLLILYNVRSERELMDTISMRLDWLWFLGYDLDSEIPNHSVLSKARNRWGVEAFRVFFERIVCQCVKAGLVDGSKLFMDSSLIRADASNNSVINTDDLKNHLADGFNEFETRLEEKENPTEDHAPKSGPANRSHISTTDPDASVTRHGKSTPKLQYKTHRSVDAKTEIITATEVTPGEVNEAHLLPTLLSMHQDNTKKDAHTIVADTKYGILENYLFCYDKGIQAHIPDLKSSQETAGQRGGIFTEEIFVFYPEKDVYLCPAGEILEPKRFHKKRDSIDYVCAPKICGACPLRLQCTTAKTGRSIKRHARQQALDWMREQSESEPAKKDIRTRQHLMERSFARATRYGFKRARWRRLWRVQIQEYITSAIQNIMAILRYVKEPGIAPDLRGAISKNRVLSRLSVWFLKIRSTLYCKMRNLFFPVHMKHGFVNKSL